MVKLKPGDRVACRLRERTIVNPYRADYDETRIFDIVASDSTGYYLFVPSYIFIKDVTKVDSFLLKKLKLNKKYLDDSFIYVNENLIYRVESQMDGAVCVKCLEFSYKSSPNQENGDFICWLCRDDPFR